MAEETGSLMPPMHILNAPTRLMRDLGYGRGYVYDHATGEGFSGQNYFPDGAARRNFYRPGERVHARTDELCLWGSIWLPAQELDRYGGGPGRGPTPASLDPMFAE